MTTVTCDKCNVEVTDVFETIIDAGWIPSYYEEGAEFETNEPLCPTCVAKCEEDRDGCEVWPASADLITGRTLEQYGK